MNVQNEIRKKLESLSEESYKKFSEKLIPGCNNMLGVRIPIIRKLAKSLTVEDCLKLLKSDDEIYFEEVMLKGFIVANLKVELTQHFLYIKKFIPKITNWSLCDSFCASLKIASKHKKEFFQFVLPMFTSEKVYTARFAVVLCLFQLGCDEYVEKILLNLCKVKNEDYYVKMAVAWCVATICAKYPVLAFYFLKQNKLDVFTHNKAIQKCRESYKVSAELKKQLLKLKR